MCSVEVHPSIINVGNFHSVRYFSEICAKNVYLGRVRVKLERISENQREFHKIREKSRSQEVPKFGDRKFSQVFIIFKNPDKNFARFLLFSKKFPPSAVFIILFFSDSDFSRRFLLFSKNFRLRRFLLFCFFSSLIFF